MIAAAAVARKDSDSLLRELLGIAPGANLVLGDPATGTDARIDVGSAIASARSTSDFGSRLMVDTISMVVIAVEVEVHEHAVERPRLQRLRRRSPELQVLRHLRNAASHGNRFRLLSGEPKHPASFGGRTISPSLEGQTAIGFAALFPPATVWRLLEAVEAQLSTLPG